MSLKKIPGTKSSHLNSQLLVSSGVPSLDHIIGGGIPVGSVFLLEEDKYGNYSRVMLKYFVAEGIVSQHPVLLASLDNDPEKLISDLPSPTNPTENDTTSTAFKSNAEDDMKIAWRYKDLNPVTSTLQSSLQFGHYYDLSTTMDKKLLQEAIIHTWNYSTPHLSEKQDGNAAYNDILLFIKEKIVSAGLSKDNNGRHETVLRVAIESLGSPFWQSHETHDLQQHHQDEAKHLIKFLYCLRAVTRLTSAVVFVTVPTHLFENTDVILHLRHCADMAVKLDSFMGTNRENNPALRDYHGLLQLPKLSSINSLTPHVPSTTDLAFKLRRKKLLIEKLHLPPELQDSSEREQDDSAFGCGGSKKLLDF